MKMHPVTLMLASLSLGAATASWAQEQPAPPPPPPATMGAMTSMPPPPPQAVYPPCTATLQDQCTNTRPESDTKGGAPAHKPRRRAH